MAYGACSHCGNSYAECECLEREQVKRESVENERRAQEWERQKQIHEKD